MASLLMVTSAPVFAAADTAGTLESVMVTARLREEPVEEVPIALSTVSAATLERSNVSNLSQLSALVPTVNYSSPNPRNTAFTIRGLGSSVIAVSQANDGLEPGVGFYVDGVYHARPATAAFDFVDLERVEILRGPQGTLFGKNTTAGAISLVSRLPTFTAEGVSEVSMGEQGYTQAKAALSGPLAGDVLAGRLSAALTERDGTLRNVRTGERQNGVRTVAFRGQLLLKRGERLSLRVSGDYASFDGQCCTQVYVATAPTLKPKARQYPALAAGLHYAPPSLNPYDRLTDIDAPVGVSTNEGGTAATLTYAGERSTLTAISAWRYWNWDAANDRDYTGLDIQTLQHVPSRQEQVSQELRIVSAGSSTIDWATGLYGLKTLITGEPISQYGSAATYWLLGPVTNNSATTYPANLLDGYGTDGQTRFTSRSAAAYGEVTWHPTRRLSVTTGLRYTAEHKEGNYASTVYGGLATANARLQKAQLSILRPQTYSANVADGSLSGRASVAYRWSDQMMTYVSYADGQKSGGINMSGLPLNPANLPALNTAVIKPERNKTVEIGAKTHWLADRLRLDAAVYTTEVHDFQTNVVDTGPGALRGYLANIEHVRVRGLELSADFRLSASVALRASSSWTDARYLAYHNGPCPIELIGTTVSVCDLTGKSLSGTPHLAIAYGAQFNRPLMDGARLLLNVDAIHRGAQYGDPADSAYTVLPAYDVIALQAGWYGQHTEVFGWVRNLTNASYLQNVTVQAGNSGLIVGTPSDPRAFGLTLRLRL